MMKRQTRDRKAAEAVVRAMAGVAVLLTLVLLGCGDSGERAAGQMVNALDRGKVTGTRGTMETIAQALRAYSVDHSSYPDADSIDAAMAELVPAHLRAALTIDAWGHPFFYRGGSDGFTLISGGQDGKIGTDDDIVMTDGRFEESTAPGGS